MPNPPAASPSRVALSRTVKQPPKAATYTKVPVTIDKVADGQISIYDELISEVAEDDDEMELMSADMEEDRKRYELLAGVGKKRKRA